MRDSCLLQKALDKQRAMQVITTITPPVCSRQSVTSAENADTKGSSVSEEGTLDTGNNSLRFYTIKNGSTCTSVCL